jgi:hypothetical protein
VLPVVLFVPVVSVVELLLLGVELATVELLLLLGVVELEVDDDGEVDVEFCAVEDWSLLATLALLLVGVVELVVEPYVLEEELGAAEELAVD